MILGAPYYMRYGNREQGGARRAAQMDADGRGQSAPKLAACIYKKIVGSCAPGVAPAIIVFF
ncbi:MAG: hypothetical protein D4R74_13100 [Betaproteobacteria bacterium]|nr:MAG: hypothetical protein D4R74_13100 [Betaproteobacteria bacterium]